MTLNLSGIAAPALHGAVPYARACSDRLRDRYDGRITGAKHDRKWLVHRRIGRRIRPGACLGPARESTRVAVGRIFRCGPPGRTSQAAPPLDIPAEPRGWLDSVLLARFARPSPLCGPTTSTSLASGAA